MNMKKILVIEDEVSLRMEISDVLSFEGFEVLQADNGLDGEKLAKQHLPDVILCDIMMPGINGIELLGRLRSQEGTNRIPFIFISALSERRHLRTGMELGADDYVTKPFTIKEILSAIRTRLDKQELTVTFIENEIAKVKNEIKNRIESVREETGTAIISGESAKSVSSRETTVKDGSILEALKSIDSNNTLKNLEKLVEKELHGNGIANDHESLLIKLRNEIKSKSNLVNNWSVFQMKFNQAYPDFVDKLIKFCPDLTSQDLTLASAILINLNTLQLAGLMNITPASVRKSRFRLKKKLKLKEEDQLSLFLHQIND
jgi:DNA-binding response OmpR family regulator